MGRDACRRRPTLVRVHMQNTLCDLFATAPGRIAVGPCTTSCATSAEAGEGVIVVLRNHDRARAIVQRIHDYDIHGARTRCRARRQDRPSCAPTGIGAQILADLGVRKMRVMSAPKAMHGIWRVRSGGGRIRRRRVADTFPGRVLFGTMPARTRGWQPVLL